ncbi:MAG TPA: glycosyltransferase family 2 protein [Candidatus Gracilibacteria bacterium]
MKGVILAGGTGSRLFPSTKVTNKHLLPVYNQPMIYYAINTLKSSGIRDILIVSSPEHAGDFMQLLGSGRDFDIDFTYRIQDGSGGVAQALSLAEDFSANDTLAVILSDNIFEGDFSHEVLTFRGGAKIFAKKVEDPERFGVVELREDMSVKSLEEKPDLPKSNLAITGFYLYDQRVFDFIRQIQPSKRGELEITDVNKMYLEKGELRASEVVGMWIDAGTHESLLEASILAQEAFDPDRISERKRATLRSPEKVDSHSPKVVAGIIIRNHEEYLRPCLQSLLAQDYKNLEIVVLDNASEDGGSEIIEDQFEDIAVIDQSFELSFGAGHNRILRETDGDFYACLSINMIFEPNFISELVKSISEKPVYGSVGGKIKKWDFKGYQENSGSVREKGKTNFIDSVGIEMLPSHRFEDIGQSDVDHGQYDEPNLIFGVSHAAALYRRKALQDVVFENELGIEEYFDELLFMYKEDVDLAYRLQWAGWKCRYAPQAVCYHDRMVGLPEKRSIFALMKNRSDKPKMANQLSYLNHQIILRKNFSSQYSLKIKKATFWYNARVFMYLLFFETETLWQWRKYFKMRNRIEAQRQKMPRRVSQKEMEAFMKQ